MCSSLGPVRARAAAALLAVALGACAARATPSGPAVGMIAGLVRDAESGQAVADAIVVVRRAGSIAPERHVTNEDGAFMIADLVPGTYDVAAYVGKVRIGERPAVVRPNEILGLDFTFTRGGPPTPDLNAPGAPELWRYRPPGADAAAGTVEGTVADIRGTRLPGAVVSITRTGTIDTVQTTTDDQGRFSVEGLAPGHYDVIAYYSVVRRGQLELRRNRVAVAGGEVVVVPLWLETQAF